MGQLRSGGFTGTLDPFGSGRGGLGRYNITGDTISSLAEYEAYAVSVAWANGNATDAEYLASLRHMVELAPEGTRERVTAENRLHDAEYAIGRNAIVRTINNATAYGPRQAAYQDLLKFEEAHLASMTEKDSQAYREQLDRIASLRGDMRQNRYSALLEQVNRGQAATTKLLSLARKLATEAKAAGDPDVDEWGQTIFSLEERVKDEQIAKAYQDYQYERTQASDVIGLIDARLAELDPQSAAYRELSRTREDFVTRAKATDANKREAEIQGLRADGKISDADYLSYLRDAYNAETPGSAEWVRAGTRLREFTFSLAEDKLRYDVGKGSRPVSDLIRFYEQYQATMTPGGERWRAMQLTIDSLKRGGSRGGGGGGSSGGPLTLGPKLIDGQAALADILGGADAPPSFADLFRIDPTNGTARDWWKNNLRSAAAAFSDRATTWTYYDPAGNAYELPFNPAMMAEFDQLDLTYMRIGLTSATSAGEAQDWVSRIITSSNALQSHGSQLTMDVFDKVWDALERQKQIALASGRLAEYSNLTMQQSDLARSILDSPYLTFNNRETITNRVAAIAPRNLEPGENYNPDGDPVLGMILDGSIIAKVDSETGQILSATLDPDKGYISQKQDGEFELVAVPQDATGFRLDPETEQNVPLYYDDHVLVTVSFMGTNAAVWQPFSDPAGQAAGDLRASLPVYREDPSGASVFAPIASRYAEASGVATKLSYESPNGPQAASLPVYTTYTVEPGGRIVTWVSLSKPGPEPGGTPDTWVALGADGSAPRIVLPPTVTTKPGGGWQINGKDVTPAEVLALARLWTSGDSLRDGSLGQPGMSFVMRRTDHTGQLDLRPEWEIDAEERNMLLYPTPTKPPSPSTSDYEARRRDASRHRAAVTPADPHDQRRYQQPLLPVAARGTDRRDVRRFGPSPIDIERSDLAQLDKPYRPKPPAQPIKTPAAAALAPVTQPKLKPLPTPQVASKKDTAPKLAQPTIEEQQTFTVNKYTTQS